LDNGWKGGEKAHKVGEADSRGAEGKTTEGGKATRRIEKKGWDLGGQKSGMDERRARNQPSNLEEGG